MSSARSSEAGFGARAREAEGFYLFVVFSDYDIICLLCFAREAEGCRRRSGLPEDHAAFCLPAAMSCRMCLNNIVFA